MDKLATDRVALAMARGATSDIMCVWKGVLSRKQHMIKSRDVIATNCQSKIR